MATQANVAIETPESTTAFSTPPHFDHVFVVVDGKTLQSINDCRFLANEEFGRFWLKESESTLLGKYRATNVFGQNTIVEFFLDRFGPFTSVNVGLVLSFDHAGEAIEARQRLQANGIPFHAEFIRRNVAGEANPVPWYHLTRPELGADCPLTMFLSEITPEYYARIGAQFGENRRQDRSAYLEALLKRPQKPEHPFLDVIGVTIRLRPDRVKTVAKILEVLGYERREECPITELRGPESAIKLVSDESAVEGLLAIQLKLKTPDTGRRFEFNEISSLVLSPRGAQDSQATWSFIPQQSRS